MPKQSTTQLPSDILSAYPSSLQKDHPALIKVLESLLPPLKELSLAIDIYSQLNDLNDDNKKTLLDSADRVKRENTKSIKAQGSWKQSHCYFAGFQKLYKADITSNHASFSLFQELCAPARLKANVEPGMYYSHVLSVRQTLISALKHYGQGTTPEREDLIEKINVLRSPDSLAKEATYAETTYLLIAGDLSLGEKRKNRQAQASTESLHDLLNSEELTALEEASIALSTPSEAVMQWQESAIELPQGISKKEKLLNTKITDEISSFRRGDSDDQESSINDLSEGKSDAILSGFMAKNPQLKDAHPAVIKRSIDFTSHASRQNNPSPSMRNTFSRSQIISWLTAIEAIDTNLAHVLLLISVTGLHPERIDTVQRPNHDDLDLCIDTHNQWLGYAIESYQHSARENRSRKLSLPLPPALIRALDQHRSSTIKIKERYQQVVKHLAFLRNPPPSRITQWRHTAHDVLAFALTPYDRELISGSISFTYSSEKHYVETNVSTLTRSFITALEQFATELASCVWLQESLAFHAPVIPDGRFGPNTRNGRRKFRVLIETLRTRLTQEKRAWKKQSLSKKIETAARLYNLLNINLALILQLAFVIRPHWQRLDIQRTGNNYHIEDKDSRQFREPRLIQLSGNAHQLIEKQTQEIQAFKKVLIRFLKQANYITESSNAKKAQLYPDIIELMHSPRRTSFQPMKQSTYRKFLVTTLQIPSSDLPPNNHIRHRVGSFEQSGDSEQLPISTQVIRSLLGHHQPGLGLYNADCSSTTNLASQQATLIDFLIEDYDLRPLSAHTLLEVNS